MLSLGQKMLSMNGGSFVALAQKNSSLIFLKMKVLLNKLWTCPIIFASPKKKDVVYIFQLGFF
jgi:hypothetical protein